MRKLEVPFLASVNKDSSVSHISLLLNDLPRQGIETAPWPDFSYRPEVAFSIAHSDDCIFIKYYVQERSVQALHWQPNGPVYKDSCVEFFLAFGEEAGYYNLEFNCIGACLCGYGSGREKREEIPEQLLDLIKYQALLQKDHAGSEDGVSWDLTLMVPLAVFCHHRLTALRSLRCRGNFFKCGDDLPEPHFLSWSPIESEKPDFHQPRFFGDLQFV